MGEAARGDVVDVVFALHGEAIAPDYAYSLQRAVSAALGWIAGEAGAGIRPIKGATISGERLVLSRRSQLILRLPRGRAHAAMALTGARFDLGAAVEVGAAALRELAPYPVLYSPFVSTGDDAEGDFVAAVARLVTAAGIECKLIVGKRREASCGATRVTGYSLMLHGLTAERSLQVQATGLGRNRMLGCGIFVAHKSIAAVGA